MYEYSIEKSKIFTESGQILFLEIRDNVQTLLKKSGAFTMGKAIAWSVGSSWLQMACVDRLVELGEILEVTNYNDVVGQNRVFVKTK